MKRKFSLWLVLGVSSLLFALPVLEGCGVVAVTGIAAALVVSDRRQAEVILLDRSTQLNSKSIANRTTKGHVEVTVYNGIVLLTGQVPSYANKLRVERVVSHVKNVNKLVSELTVGPDVGVMQRAKDSALTARIKADISQIKNPSSSLVRVVTENSVVYLMGIVTREEAKAVSSRVRVIPGVEKVVEVFQIVSQETADLLDGRYSNKTSKSDNMSL
ncbi:MULTISPECIES: BON domain-containing protein [Candidatus Ichthyocystis]|uniref:Putative membrane protein, BON domain n=2 Tax=Candidatus Ichthyocystis hellenicum TaxID=1561003 RepID=A0A0S4M3X1_9BURK|nr:MULTISPECIES: BON domain-containing protein [Ichthyocystis]CUT17995.1 putative membrane protein, BON domain [Candidatus Ichthyocystis hellenicum]